jgi:hypothetical protein
LTQKRQPLIRRLSFSLPGLLPTKLVMAETAVDTVFDLVNQSKNEK